MLSIGFWGCKVKLDSQKGDFPHARLHGVFRAQIEAYGDGS